MSQSALTLKALGRSLMQPGRAWQNRIWAHRARLGGRPEVAETLPEPMLLGDADAGQVLVGGRWPAFGHRLPVAPGSIWEAQLPEPGAVRLEAERQACLWLDDLAALGSRPARVLAQGWIQDWIRRYGSGAGPGWQPEIAGRRAERWSAHAAMLTQGLDRTGSDRFFRALAAQQRYLVRAWPRAEPGLPRLRALTGLVWSGRVLPHPGHAAAVAALAELADATIDADGAVASRAPEELAEMLILAIWSARMLDDAGQHPAPAQLGAIARAVPVLRRLRLGDGTTGRFHDGGPGHPERLDQALAELRLGVQAKPKLAMGYARLTGGRVVLLMDGGALPAGAAAGRAHAGTLAFEMSVGRQPLVVNAGSGRGYGPEWAHLARQTAAHSTVEVDGRSSARIATRGLAARTFGAQLVDGPTLVSVRQAQDGTGMWLLATHDGYVASHGLVHERRLFVEARGREARGEEILSVTDARARAQFDRAARGKTVGLAARFHLHPAIQPEHDEGRQAVRLTLPSGEVWMFRAAGGRIELEESVLFDPAASLPVGTTQVVVRAEVVEYLGQITWSFGRVTEALPGPEIVEDAED